MADAGRNTLLTEDLLRKIKQSILDGNDLRATAKICGINELTLYDWTCDNYLNLTDKIEGWKRDRKLKLADTNIDGILCLGIEDKDSLKVVADMSKFVKETLDKQNYSKRSELTGKGGEALIPENTEEIKELTKKLNAIHGGANITSDGGVASTMGEEVSN